MIRRVKNKGFRLVWGTAIGAWLIYSGLIERAGTVIGYAIMAVGITTIYAVIQDYYVSRKK